MGMTLCVAEIDERDYIECMILGHAAAGWIGRKTIFPSENLAGLAAAAYAPDFIDKGAALLFGAPDRGFGHSLIFFGAMVLLGTALVGLKRLRTTTVVAWATMWAVHLATDLLDPAVLGLPFVAPLPDTSHLTTAEKTAEFFSCYLEPSLSDPILWLEAAFILGAALLYAFDTHRRTNNKRRKPA